MAKKGVYRLETYRFLKKYSRFMRSNPRAFPEFYPDKNRDGKWIPPRLSANWRPHKLIGDVWPENDYPGEGAPAYLTPVFSARAVAGLREFLQPNGELLPVLTPLGTYYAFNVTKVVPALDVRKSEVVRWPRSKYRVTEVVRFVFKPKILEKLTIFKIPQMPVEIYVTEPFVRRVRELGLNGMWITKCWPMPKGVRWLKALGSELECMRAEREKANPEPHSLRGLERAVRAPKILDLRKDVDALEGLLKRVTKWIKSRQKGWAKKGESVSGIGLESIGWDLDGGPIVMCHVDTRECHAADGLWSHFEVARIARPKWTALPREVEESEETEGERVLIDVRGKRHIVQQDDDRLNKWYDEVMVAALKQARSHALFRHLRKPRKCLLSAINTDSGLAWRGNATAGRAGE